LPIHSLRSNSLHRLRSAAPVSLRGAPAAANAN
jgi:hypothetical protein